MKTFINCLLNIADPMLLPSMRNGEITSQMVVNNTLQFNNLHTVKIFIFLLLFIIPLPLFRLMQLQDLLH
jgi:hypothetical protein